MGIQACSERTYLLFPSVSSGSSCPSQDPSTDRRIPLSNKVIRCLLIYPNPESALDEEAGKLLLEAYED